MTTYPVTGGTVVQFSAIGNTAVKDAPGDSAGVAASPRLEGAAVAASNDRHITVACAVRDISATGVRLRVEGSLTHPRHL